MQKTPAGNWKGVMGGRGHRSCSFTIVDPVDTGPVGASGRWYRMRLQAVLPSRAEARVSGYPLPIVTT